MSTVTLTVREPPAGRADASPLQPAALAACSVAEIERIVLAGGNDAFRVGDLFAVARRDDGDASEPALVIEGAATAWLDRVGAQMDGGALVVRGAAGDYAGVGMQRGALTIERDAGDFAGCAMRGGRIAIGGRCGDFAAGALPGDMEGMRGGTLTVTGSAGARLADRMRRGLVLVGGDAGDYAAARLVAGTVGVAGRVGAHYAYGMRRGTLLLARAPARVPPTFVAGGCGFDVFWALLARSLAASGCAPFDRLRDTRPPTRYAGDLAVDGRGEIFVLGGT